MIEINVLQKNKANEWDNLVERNLYSTAFHLWEWGEILSSCYNYQKYYLAATQDNKLIGLFPLIHVKSTLFGNRFISLPFCEYGGPLTDPLLSDRESHRVIDILVDVASKLAREIGVEYVEIRGLSIRVAEESLCSRDYDGVQRYVTFRVDLTKDIKELWSNLHKTRTRKAVKKAIKSGVMVKKVGSREELHAYYMLYLKNVKRLGSPPHAYEFFEKLQDVFYPKNKLKFLLAEYKGKTISGIITFYHGKTIISWGSATDVEYRGLSPHNLLLWHTIEWGVENNFHSLYLGRTRKGSAVYDFKSGWGGQEINLQDYAHFLGSTKRKLPDPAQSRYKYISKLWSLMPIALSKRIGPKVIGGIAL